MRTRFQKEKKRVSVRDSNPHIENAGHKEHDYIIAGKKEEDKQEASRRQIEIMKKGIVKFETS